jgi:ATP-dependent 26S proteasome regulatory subunit
MTPFPNSDAHLLAELERIDLMIRARIAHLRRIQAEDEHFRGLYISEEEVDALLARPLGQPQWLGRGDQAHLSASDKACLGLAEVNTRRRDASLKQGIDLRLDRLARLFDLDPFDLDVVLVCLAVEIDLRYQKLYAYLQDDVTKKRPSVDLATHLLASPGLGALQARRHFLPTAPLIAQQIVHLVEDPEQPMSPLLARILKPDERIVEFLFGNEEIDARLRDFVAIENPQAKPALTDSMRDRLHNAWSVSMPGRQDAPWPVFVLSGSAGSGRRTAAAAMATNASHNLLLADLSTGVPADPEPGATSAATRWDVTARLLEREAVLRKAAIHWRGLDGFAGDAQRTSFASLLHAIDAGRAPCFLSVPQGLDVTASAFPRRGIVAIPMPEASLAQRERQWSEGLAGASLAANADLAVVASRFKLNLGIIDQAATTARRLAGLRGRLARITTRDLLDACRLHSNQKLATLARKISPHHGWNDIVLPDERMAQLREICNHVKFRDQVYGDWGFGQKLALGKGLAVLFAGPSGTGKTMAAGIIATELGLDLYKIDLSTVISKYIGETEKNLSRIFEEAETSNAILFFDEADALFGKRSEVRDSHDRYANVEVGYLLQRMEEYEGVAILATNLRKNMDDAFVRRLHFTVEFPFPDQQDRLRIWQGIWPKNTPLDKTIDLHQLAERYEMAGGNIKNIAVAAAFLAADDGQVVRAAHVLRATMREYQKIGKLIVENSDFAILGRRGGRQ